MGMNELETKLNINRDLLTKELDKIGDSIFEIKISDELTLGQFLTDSNLKNNLSFVVNIDIPSSIDTPSDSSNPLTLEKEQEEQKKLGLRKVVSFGRCWMGGGWKNW